ncbi:alpha/beta hydrolase [Calycomorphotria hydatis]|uniref:Aminoacrylate hydrolase RutD n=1 Tax=Calycomorphotria hydatis TaxID=2528027 RepID=A0A517TFE5_9PLAN|nr:alpha/beta hydrolase [Calycomorphotria hydatis]QDT67100.1 Putative aminoacrylate hydrolase RutD [Calycomorphotria hydatis]
MRWMSPALGRRLRRYGQTAFLVYIFIVLMLAFLQRYLMYPATKALELPAQQVAHRFAGVPEFGGLEDIRATTEDGLTLHGWHTRVASESSPAPAIILFHGNGGNRAGRLWEYQTHAELGAETIAFDYRGYGENEGSPSETGLLHDANAVWNYATNDAGLQPEQLILMGGSLGGGVAVQLAAKLCREGTPPAGIILRSTFYSMTDAAASHYPFLPVRWVLLDRYESFRFAPEITCPVLILHGDRDIIVPHSEGLRLFEQFPSVSSSGSPKQFVTLPEAGHNDYHIMADDEFRRAMGDFINHTVSKY